MKKLKAYKYSITPEVTSQYEAIGRAGEFALNELNQYMATAKKEKSTANHHVYTHAKSGLTLFLQRKYNVIDRIELTEKPFAQTVKFTKHSINRIVERLEQSEITAENYVRQLLASAAYHGKSRSYEGPCDIYVHKKSGVTIVVDSVKKCVVTVYKAEEAASSLAKITIDRIANAIQREFKLMKTQLTREVRRLTEQHAELSVRAAELALNKARCKAPHTQKLIQSRIEEFTTHINHLALEIDEKLTQIKTAESEVKAVTGE